MNASGIHYPIDGPPRGALPTARRFVRRTASSRWVSPAWSQLVRGRAAFLTLHRFAERDHGLYGHDRELVRSALARLRRERYALLGVEDAVRMLVAGEPLPRRSVVFTMDDGYRGALEQCADIFAEYDCPLTVFVTTGFLDRTCWLWWDQVEYACISSGRPSLAIDWNGQVRHLDLSTRRRSIGSLVDTWEWCKTLGDDEKWRFIAALAEAADVDLPTNAPEQYAPLSWADARSLERRGISFGPHTVTHPVLPRTTDAQSDYEITHSWARVRQELANPVNVFSYPNGDYGAREIRTLEREGLAGAVTTVGAYATSSATSGTGRFEIPRFGYPEMPDPVCLIASGFTRMELAVQRLLR